MASWDCDFVRKTFPDSRIRQEGGRSEVNGVPMSSDWTASSSLFPGAERFPEGAPKVRPFYWDIAKASEDERFRKWGKKPREVVEKIVQSAGVPYWLPKQEAEKMGWTSEMWFHPPGAGALAHMDPHCVSTVSFCFSGRRKWRMMLPPERPHPEGYFDGQIYGASDPSREGEWRPTFELEAPAGSAVVVFPGMVHETLSTGEACSSSVSQTFDVPVAAAYYRSFWPRLSRIQEEMGRCGGLVEDMVVLGSGLRVPPAEEAKARKAGKRFAKGADADGNGRLSEEELMGQAKGNGKESRHGKRKLAELVSFHDTSRDGVVTVQEVVDSWIMFATASRRIMDLKRKGEL